MTRANKYMTALAWLDKHVYREIEKGALLEAIKRGREPIYLNNHGKEHVHQVMSRATELLRESQCSLDPYEAYLLLTAILFHDTGIVFGREEHERKCLAIMSQVGSSVFDDTAEKRVIAKIASAHGGLEDDDKDTIGRLDPQYMLLGKPVRKRFLAALLRFADELADDRSRASRFMLENGLLGGSEVYHAYSQALQTVGVTEREIQLHFELNRGLVIRPWAKGDRQTYLVDEIYERTLKMHVERIYCMRFLRSDINMDSIRVRIEIFEDDFMEYEVDPIAYSLNEIGYPKLSSNICDLCPDLRDWSGQALKERLLSSGGDEDDSR